MVTVLIAPFNFRCVCVCVCEFEEEGRRKRDPGSHRYFLATVRAQPTTHPDAWPRSPAPLNMNHYANKKSAAESMLDVALLMANASQLKAVLEQGPSFHFYTPTITLISISLCLQITVGVLLIFIVRWNLNDEQKHQRLNFMENLATGLVFIIVVVNVFITAFGVHRTNYSN
uniref:Ninjurin 1 n=1 Tax=Pundamilia nyererei TaxID=303518 RepID=A0A3B4F9E6_9CICH